MVSYKIYLTRSNDAALLISKGFETDGWISTSHGAVTKNLASHIPSIYHDKGYYHATLQYESEKEEYELTIC